MVATLIWILVVIAPARAQFAEQVIDAGLYNQPINSTTVARAAVLAANKVPEGSTPSATDQSDPASPDVTAITVQFHQAGVQLPSCPVSRVLLTDQGVPQNWGDLSAEEQAVHPANALIIQMAHAVWRNNPAEELVGCLGAMGVDKTSIRSINVQVPEYGGKMTALLMRAGNKAVFVSFRGTDFEDLGDVLIDADCRHTANVRAAFGGKGNIRVHSGFWAAWQALEPQITEAMKDQLKHVSGPKRVYFIGHSLGASLAAIAALRYNHLWSGAGSNSAKVSGVWLFGCPRIGNAGWQKEYNRHLLGMTLRISNYADFAARLPMQLQICPLAATAHNATFTFSHIGRSLLLCPNPLTGLVKWQSGPTGSETVDCGLVPDLPDLTLKTHWLGAYLDAWRRGVAGATGNHLADTVQVRNTICAECTGVFEDMIQQVNLPARAGGPVTCSTTASCIRPGAWDAATLVGANHTKAHKLLSICLGYLCT